MDMVLDSAFGANDRLSQLFPGLPPLFGVWFSCSEGLFFSQGGRQGERSFSPGRSREEDLTCLEDVAILIFCEESLLQFVACQCRQRAM
jgi:hypothetical protein